MLLPRGRCQFLAHYTDPGGVIVADLSNGYNGSTHPGRVMGSRLGEEGTGVSYPGPTWVEDPTAPFRTDLEPARVRTAPTAPATPVGAKIFDSFSRPDNMLAWSTATAATSKLGSTETGSLGPQAWQNNLATQPWGVFDGRAVFNGTTFAMAWVLGDSADMDVQVTRRIAAGLGDANGATAEMGVAVRVQDANSSLVCFAQNGVVYLRSINGAVGTQTVITNWTPPNNTWQTLRVTTAGTTVTVYVDSGAGGWTLLGSVTSSLFQTAVGAGLYHNSGGFGLVRWDDFTVY